MCNFFRTCITAGIWTIVQTIFQLIWTISGYLAYKCSLKPSNYMVVFVYITYFYDKKCGPIKVDPVTIEYKDLNNSSKTIPQLYDVIIDVVQKAVFKEESLLAYRTNVYVQNFIIFDILWILTAGILMIGACYNVRKTWVFVCYCPWLLVTALLVLLDTTSAVHFGLDIVKQNSISKWLNFIGVTNSADFQYMENYDLGPLIIVLPSIILASLCGRFFIFWIPNIHMFYTILSHTVMVYQKGRFNNFHANTERVNSSLNATGNSDAEARIRQWQLYYGSVNSVQSSISTIEIDQNANSSNSTIKKPKKHVVVQDYTRRQSNDSSVESDFEMFSQNRQRRYSRSSSDNSNSASTSF